ncbi:heme ABC transporter substrate-binding protein IsdE [Helcococcus ovis]|uniref:heme ABC transporter substrate-binding protein IsdE n=1 Tax=Helcococcus ovis TaxID=72026 RepID=UPI0038BC2C32
MIKKFNFVVILLLSIFLTGCVNQHPDKKREHNVSSPTKKSVGENHKLGVIDAKKIVENSKSKPKIIATSPSIADICDKLNLELVGISNSNIYKLPKKYKNVEKIGLAMNPDLEKISKLNPDWILSPNSLIDDLKPKYETIKSDWAFLNLNSVGGMYQSIKELGYIFGKEKEANKLILEFNKFYEEYKRNINFTNKPKVMILMGLPGSYLIATNNSYIGDLVNLAGGENVYHHEYKQFLNVNTEDMKTKNPDIILRAAHALPKNVKKMFDDDFNKNDIWKHFSAVKNNKVFDLSYDKFGMSARFNYQDALKELSLILFNEEKKNEKN